MNRSWDNIRPEAVKIESAAEAVQRAENARLQGVVNDLAQALKTVVGGPRSLHSKSSLGAIARKVLEKHGLLRPQDRPEMVPDVWSGGGGEEGR